MLRLLTLTVVSVYNGCQRVVWNNTAYETPSARLLPICNCNLKDMWLERFLEKIQFMAIENKTNSLNTENWNLFMTRLCIGERKFTIDFCSIMFIDCIDRHFFEILPLFGWHRLFMFIWFNSIQFCICNTVFDIYIVQFGNTTFIFDLVRDFFVAIISFWCNYFFKYLFRQIFVKPMHLQVW